MGLSEQLLAGGVLERKATTFITDLSGAGSVLLGSAYAVLGVEVSAPCRLRLYDNQPSRDDAAEASRPFGDVNISASVSLIADFSMSAAGKYTVDPVLYGVVNNLANPQTFYSVTPASEVTVTITNFSIEDSNIAVGSSGYSIGNRRGLPIFTGSSAAFAAGAQVSGSIVASTIPQTYLLVSASLDNAAHRARLRLYSTSGSLYSTSEKSRAFSTEPSSSANLIVDMILSGSQVTYFVPKIMGSNIQNMGTNLLSIRGNDTLISGKNELYYILDNVGPSAAAISASVHVYSLED
jgi:hypothetical protein